MKNMTTIAFVLVALAGVAFAGDPKAGAPAVPAVPAKDAKAPDAKDMPKMVPPQQVADMIKAMGGTWKCTGSAELGGQTLEIKATITHKADLDNWWIQTSFVGTAGKMPPFKFNGYTSYDSTSNKWYRTMVNGRGGHGTAWGTQTGNKIAWEGEGRMMGMDSKSRETEEIVSPKEVHVLGEYSRDGGKTWVKDHEATCKK